MRESPHQRRAKSRQGSLQSEQMWRARNRNTGGGFGNAQQSNEVLRGFIYIINTNIRFK